ncbi:zinc finger domain-containing protein [Mycolicibacterium vanbaalenii]|uniref:zinc finger domain-containing protein n=1 Tax=Mycolicibacterium vanbaalenii TaxID=110539 RepID=UPI004035267F
MTTAFPDPLTTHCPLCDSKPGDPCRDAIRGLVREVGPHLSRIAASVDPEGARRGGAR